MFETGTGSIYNVFLRFQVSESKVVKIHKHGCAKIEFTEMLVVETTAQTI